MTKTKEHAGNRKDAISLRTWPSLRFAVEFAARIRMMSVTTWCEQAMLAASEVYVPGTKLTWRDFEHASEGVSWVKMALDPRIPMGSDEEPRRRFIVAHKTFFLDGKGAPDIRKVEVLWRLIDFYVEDWSRSKDLDAHATGKQMAEHLRRAKLEPPHK